MSLFIVLSKQRSSRITPGDPPRSRVGSLVDLFVALDRTGRRNKGEIRDRLSPIIAIERCLNNRAASSYLIIVQWTTWRDKIAIVSVDGRTFAISWPLIITQLTLLCSIDFRLARLGESSRIAATVHEKIWLRNIKMCFNRIFIMRFLIKACFFFYVDCTLLFIFLN